MLVLLRLALGCHFLYEGIWKIRHADQFVGETEGFLSGARGPMAGFFYGMIPDIDGHRRLEGNLAEVEVKDAGEVKDAQENPKKQLKLAKSWDELRQQFVDFYRPGDGKDDTKKLHEQLAKEAKRIYERQVQGLNEFVKENGDKIKEHFKSLKRYEEGLKTDPHTPFMTQRRWDEMQELRNEAKGWIADLDSRENALKAELTALLSKPPKLPEAATNVPAAKKAEANPKSKVKAADKSKSAAGTTVVLVDFNPLAENHAAAGPFASSPNPLTWKRTQQLAFLLTWSLFGIGLCLMLGLFTRPAALAGAGFMLFVVLSQPSYPGVYPLDPPQLGHALLVNKDFVEMIALLVVASTSLGRWTGLDFFLHNFLIKPFCGTCCSQCTTEGQ